MRYITVAKTRNKLTCAFFSLLVGLVGATALGSQPSYAQSTGVYATLCGASSNVTITQPTNDSTVTTSTITIKGAVAQSNQIEIYIDDIFDNTIPLTVGQTHYEGSAQLTAGTHTIKLVAINSCSGADGSAQSVITYAPPPATSSSGDAAATNVDGGDGAITIGSPHASDESPSQEPLPFLGVVTKPLENLLEWLNITTLDKAESPSALSLPRAVVVTAGMYLLVMGMATSVTTAVSASAFASTILPSSPPATRLRVFKVGFRGVGLVILLAALFL